MCLTLCCSDCLENLCSRLRQRKTAPFELIGTLSKIQNHRDWHQITRVVFYFFGIVSDWISDLYTDLTYYILIYIYRQVRFRLKTLYGPPNQVPSRGREHRSYLLTYIKYIIVHNTYL